MGRRGLRALVRSVVPREDWILIVSLAVVAALLVFVLLAGQVAAGRTQTFDELVLTRLRRPDDPSVPIGPGWLESAALDLTALGSGAVLILLVAATLGYLMLARHWALVGLTLVATIGGTVLGTALKDLFGRTRPTVVPHLQHVTSASFPSGHSMLSAVVYLTLGALLARSTDRWRLRVYFITVAMGVSFIVGATRIYLGVHYPSDVMAGWLAGFVWAVLCALVARALQRRGLASQPGAVETQA